MTLGKMADTAGVIARQNGHRLTPWSESRDLNGRKWWASCRTCGALALAEYTASGGVGRAGTTQVRKCAAVVKSKQLRRLKAGR